ncbi:MAG: LamG-like jellyroll fold domain-containing protein, partial [Verrucomicrobiota bacterium]
TDWHELDIGLDPLVAEPNPSETGVAPTLAKGLIAYWDFNGDSIDRAGNFDGRLSEKTAFIAGKFDQALRFEPWGQVDILDEPNEVFEFKDRSFSISMWIQAEGAGQGALNPLLQYRGAKTWYVLLHQKIDEDPERSTQNLFLNPGVELPALFLLDTSFGEPSPFPQPELSFLYGGSRHNFRRNEMSHIAVIFDITANRTFNYVNGQLSSWQGQSGPGLDGQFDPGLMLGNQAWKMDLDDLAIWERALAPVEIGALYDEGRGIALAELLSSDDQDGDGLPDVWEEENGFDVSIDDGDSDADEDGLTNLQEYLLRTDPRDPDSDQDGALDGVETGTGVWKNASDRGTDPVNPDSDGDGLLDGVENPDLVFVDAMQTGTDPHLRDTDGDLFEDREEVEAGSDPASAGSVIELSTGLVSYWPLDGSAKDRVGQSSGVLKGSPTFVKGEHGAGILLNGLDQRIDVFDNVDRFEFPEIQDFTVSAWIRVASHPIEPDNRVYPTIIGHQGSNSNWKLDMRNDWVLGPTRFEYGGLALFPSYGLSPSPLRTQRIDDEQWHHIVGVSDGGRELISLYLDGVLIPQPRPNGDSIIGGRRGPRPSEVPLVIGADPLGGNSGWSGVIDDLAVWKRALKGFEVTRVCESNQSLGALIDPVDSDGDGLEDSWEERFGLKLALNDSEEDPDEDGLTNLAEFDRGTDPLDPDSDADGLKDGVETGTGRWKNANDTGTFPNRLDSDGDGLIDGMESPDPAIAGPGKASDPNQSDTDADGAGDLAEATAASDPMDPISLPGNHWNVRVVESKDPINTFDQALEALASDDPDLLISSWKEPVIDWVTEILSTEVVRDSNDQGVLENDEILFPHVRIPSTKVGFAIQAEGVFFIRTRGIYSFVLRARDARFSIDGEEVGRIPAGGANKTRVYSLHLEAGSHQIEVTGYGANLSGLLELGITGVPGADQVEDARFELLTVADSDRVPLDSDRDGLLDATEFSFFPGDLTKLSYEGDWDGDGLTDGSELTNGTSPVSAANSLITLYTFDGEIPLANQAYRGEEAVVVTGFGGTVTFGEEPLVAGEAVALASEARQSAFLEAPIGPLKDFSLSLWFNAVEPDGPAQILASRGTDLEKSPAVLFLLNGALYWQGRDNAGNEQLISSPTTIELGQTYQVAVVHQSSPLKTILYLDGQPSAETTWPDETQWSDLEEPLVLGGLIDQNGFNGRIDQLAVYSRQLSPEEVLKLYQNPSGVIDDLNQGIEGRFSFRILSIGVTSTGRELQWESIPGRRYRIEYASSLASGGFAAIDELVADGSVTRFMDVDRGRFEKQAYYRVALLEE